MNSIELIILIILDDEVVDHHEVVDEVVGHHEVVDQVDDDGVEVDEVEEVDEVGKI